MLGFIALVFFLLPVGCLNQVILAFFVRAMVHVLCWLWMISECVLFSTKSFWLSLHEPVINQTNIFLKLSIRRLYSLKEITKSTRADFLSPLLWDPVYFITDVKHVVQNKMTCFHPCNNSTPVKSLMPGINLSLCLKGLQSSQEETGTGFCLFSSSLFISHQGELIEQKEFLIWVTCHSSSSGWGYSISSFVWHSQNQLAEPAQAECGAGSWAPRALCLCGTNPAGGFETWIGTNLSYGVSF